MSIAIKRLSDRLMKRDVPHIWIGGRHITWTIEGVRWDAYSTMDGGSIRLRVGNPLTPRQAARVGANVGRRHHVVDYMTADGAVGHTLCQCGGKVGTHDRYCRYCGCLLIGDEDGLSEG